jgi:hypothetical protein
MSKPIAIKRAQMLTSWDYKEMPPFSDVPPKNNPKLLGRLFTGRSKEIDRALMSLLDGSNLLVRGVWGVGKTTFILQTLHEFISQTRMIGKSTLPIYIDNFKGGLLSDFYRLVLSSLSIALADFDKDAASIANAVKGIGITHSKSKSVKGQVEINLLTVGKVGGEISAEGGSEKHIGTDNPEFWVEELLTLGSVIS